MLTFGFCIPMTHHINVGNVLYVNEPNKFERPNCYFGHGTDAQRKPFMGLFAKRKIEVGDEITTDYGQV